MTKQTIEIEGLPEGWIAVAYRKPFLEEHFIGYDGQLNKCSHDSYGTRLIVEKPKPRRIVLDETDEDNVMDGKYWKDQGFLQGKVLVVSQSKIWREVKEE